MGRDGGTTGAGGGYLACSNRRTALFTGSLGVALVLGVASWTLGVAGANSSDEGGIEHRLGPGVVGAELDIGPDIEPEIEPDFERDVLGFIERHCAGCHGGERPKAGVDLTLATEPEDLWEDAFTWSDVRSLVHAGDMPPAGEPVPEPEERERLIAALDRFLMPPEDAAPYSGRGTLRRLNRFEYDRTVRDLIGVSFDSSRTFPADSAGYGFDNVGDVLFLTPTLIEKYFDATEEVLDLLYAAPEALERVIVARPEDPDGSRVGHRISAREAARRTLEPLMTRAFRRPVSAEELEARLDVAGSAWGRGLGFEASLRPAIQSVLLSPNFLFRVEQDRADLAEWRISDWELATRLSYFLWSAPPDQELLDHAARGELSKDAMLVAQVARMLADPRAGALSESFAAQWLRFREVRTIAVDVRRYRPFRQNLRKAMYQESSLFFERIVREDRSVLELIDADWTYLNNILAEHYGIDGVQGSKMRPVSLEDRRRGGVLTQASVLTVTSYPLRTSPVVRGAYVLESILGTPPPPPPPNAGTLPDDDVQKDGLGFRERLERHRADPACAACHAKIDPLGFALESYDGIGAWRVEAQGLPIDTGAVLPDGRRIEGPIGLKDALLRDPEGFLAHLGERLFVYALGRPVEPADQPALELVLERARARGWRFHAFVEGVVLSHAFRHRSAPE